MYRLTTLTLLAATLVATPGLHAATKTQKPAAAKPSTNTNVRWYRFYDDKQQPTVSDRVTEEHVIRGYEILDSGMRPVGSVPPQRILTPEELAIAKQQREIAAQRARDDKQLLRLYPRQEDAEHARDRQIETIQVRIDFSNNTLNRLRQNRSIQTQKAATFERAGKPVPKDLRSSIESIDKQIKQNMTEVQTRQKEQEKVRQDFDPIIKRLGELTNSPPRATAAPTALLPE